MTYLIIDSSMSIPPAKPAPRIAGNTLWSRAQPVLASGTGSKIKHEI
ncbi:hypothetical protein [Phaeobacter gallaeciensis]|nr:hypothetical protein [Phaeobacter gallaeciensis]MDE4140970.1 hypothetical protein [Phaeobacter gallaeciensis]MDE4149415.1 hypothetical protein [Phaeobacter gallaeciensis]MDE4153392.1 hypothetical protein [Phaeobacter gallaeciensis]MDE4228781.1 hypothetical protein [Phaeobacter gallaeciensis]MDE4257856.1 hypothetical protein [Phaeobacter gallaeciensis]